MIDIFVPVYNEGENIKKLFDEFQDKIRSDFEVMIVYDFEEDDTLPVIRKIQNNYNFNIRLEKNHYGRGANGAFRTGMESVKHDYIVFTMADLSDSIETINEMKAALDSGYDMVVGSRYMKGGKKIGDSFLKTFFSKCAGKGMHFLIGIPTHDISNGFKMYKRKVVKNIQLESNKGFEIGLELTMKTYLQGYKITEVPAIWRDRTVGESHFKMWRWLPLYLYWCFYALQQHWLYGKPQNKGERGHKR